MTALVIHTLTACAHSATQPMTEFINDTVVKTRYWHILEDGRNKGDAFIFPKAPAPLRAKLNASPLTSP
jgi:hypothetical protein